MLYGVNLLGASLAYYLLQRLLMRAPHHGPRLRDALGTDVKGKLSPILYVIGIGLAIVDPRLALVPFVAVAVMWLAPDRRIEHYLDRREVGV